MSDLPDVTSQPPDPPGRLAALMADMTDRQREAFDAHTFGYDDATRAEVFREIYLGPCAGSGREWTDEQLDAFAARWREAAGRGGHPRLLTPLPRRVRLRLWATRQADAAGSWLCGHHAGWAAVALWRALGMWP